MYTNSCCYNQQHVNLTVMFDVGLGAYCWAAIMPLSVAATSRGVCGRVLCIGCSTVFCNAACQACILADMGMSC